MTTHRGRPVALWLSVWLALVPACAHPDTPVTPPEFESMTEGRTIEWTLLGHPFGTEQYLPGRLVLWAIAGGGCQRGRWYDDAGAVCFAYEGGGTAVCWTISRAQAGLVARPRGDSRAAPLVAASVRSEPLACPGPEVGT